MMLKVDGVALNQINLGHRHNLAFHLAATTPKTEFGHVFDARRFPPARLADQVTNIKRSAARTAGDSGSLILALTPLAFNPLNWFIRIGMSWGTAWRRTKGSRLNNYTDQFYAVI
jgi:hypothetical protein